MKNTELKEKIKEFDWLIHFAKKKQAKEIKKLRKIYSKILKLRKDFIFNLRDKKNNKKVKNELKKLANLRIELNLKTQNKE